MENGCLILQNPYIDKTDTWSATLKVIRFNRSTATKPAQNRRKVYDRQLTLNTTHKWFYWNQTGLITVEARQAPNKNCRWWQVATAYQSLWAGEASGDLERDPGGEPEAALAALRREGDPSLSGAGDLLYT
jgi:hypothetical protein